MNSASLGMRPGRVGGFTLVELMMVVAVVAILAVIAYPSYQDQLRKARRGQVKADIAEYAQLAERFHTVNNTYQGFALPVLQSPREAGATAYYTLAINTTQATFTISATATSAGGQSRDKCGNMSLNQAGVKTSAAPISECW